MRGLGDAIRHGRSFIGSTPAFGVLLGDTVMRRASPLPAMVSAWNQLKTPSVALEPCPPERVSRYGIAGGRQISQDLFQIDRLAEKPRPDLAPALFGQSGSPLPPHAFAARYLLPPAIFDLLDSTAPGLAGEIQLTDAMNALLPLTGLLGVTWQGKRLDIGTPDGLIDASLSFRSSN